MLEFDKILLVWRKGSGSRREAVGEILHRADNSFIFKYYPNTIELKETEGFTPYTEFQDLNKEYSGNVVDIFAQRLTKNGRADIQGFYDFWQVDNSKSNDKFYILGKTQGLVATDNFEFLADYNLVPNLCFITELAGLTYCPIVPGVLMVGDKLSYELETNNEKDGLAVKVFKGNVNLGYIKKYHTRVFHESGEHKLNLSVKALDQNGTIKRVFLKVEF